MAKDYQLLELTADIVAAHLINNSVSVGDVPRIIEQVHGALSSVGGAEILRADKKGIVSVRKSLSPDYLICMECGAKQKILKRHLMTAHGMTREQYRSDYGLPADYPMIAPNYSERRRNLAKSLGLGRKKGERVKRSPK